uniref:AAA family ATPase n=1 Tax=Desulforadius tongensis TaxID=1216062 RepID=UPI001EE523D8|nr:AAA family ATPase [Desulforadius tongensis]
MVKIRMWHNHERAEKNESPKKPSHFRRKPIYSVKKNNDSPSVFNEQTPEKGVQEIMAEINKLVGLKSVKKLINELHAFIEIQKLRHREKLAYEPMVLHMVFKGNPGTGKTTMARLLGQLFKEMGVLNKGHIIEVERADLVGEYIGHTAKRTRDQIKKALGGILFIDEAYSLARGGDKDFGKEAIDCMVKAMEDYKDNLIIILAGYKHEMECFIETNPGLRSRFPIHITFPDYTIQELMEIAKVMLDERQYKLTADAKAQLRTLIKNRASQHMNSGNARMVRNLIERAMRLQAVRLLNMNLPKISREDLMTITVEDVINAYDELTED